VTVHQPADSAIRRALRRARDGAALDVTEAAVLMATRGDQLTELMSIAAAVRDSGRPQAALSDTAAGRPITYSRKVFIPLTRLCRDRCHYCTFATVPHRLPAAYLEIDEVVELAGRGAELGCKEALFTLGDRPEERWPQAREWLDARGYESTLDYVRAAAIAVLERTGLLPHLNPGVMSWAELQRLKPVAPSMGMMLETTARRLFTEPGGAHYGSPDKDPDVRLRVLTDAGRLNVPFTTGILVGIGENRDERAESLFAIRATAREFGAIQEVIVQNFRAKDDTAMRNDPDLDLDEYLATLAVSRLVLGPKLHLQAPPNLVDLTECLLLLDAGVDDLGGISPLTPDHVNPERPWPELDKLTDLLAGHGYRLVERLTAQPSYIRAETPWLDPRLLPHVRALADPATGLAAIEPDGTSRRPRGLPWQEPDADWVSAGRTDLFEAIDTTGRTTDRRGDFDEVYGDWNALRERVFSPGSTALDADVKAALAAAERDPASLTDEQALTLMQADGAGLDAVAALADQLRQDAVGEDVTYIVNRNINFTNICYTGCRFCAFAQRASDADAYTLSTVEIGDRVREARADGATEICMQGGIDPNLPASGYFDLARAVKAAVPDMHLHAFSPMEVVNGASRANLSIEEFLLGLKEAGVDSLPGTAAEILDDEVRWVLTKGKLPTSAWIEVVTTAHRIGIPTTSTMMFGHVDHPRHWVAHLKLLARLQDETGGFTEFVPLPFVHNQSPIYLAGLARAGASQREVKAVHAMARIMLHGRIANIQTSWVKLGEEGAAEMLRGGANDLGGTLMEETISRMAGSEHGSRRSMAELAAVAQLAGRPARQRTTLYGRIDEAAPAPLAG
jgi:FO synthase